MPTIEANHFRSKFEILLVSQGARRFIRSSLLAQGDLLLALIVTSHAPRTVFRADIGSKWHRSKEGEIYYHVSPELTQKERHMYGGT